jgi:hypothetical protein
LHGIAGIPILANKVAGVQPFPTIFVILNANKTNRTMKENWVRILSSTDLMKVKIAEDVLKQNNIESHIVNKPDSIMPMLGEAELFTLPEKVDTALKVLRDNKIE